MLSRIFCIFSLLIVAGSLIGGCKGSATDSNGNTHIDIGDSIPRLHSSYLYQTAQLDMSNNVIPGTLSQPNHSAIVVSTGLAFSGKNNVYLVLDDGDSCYYTYEPSSDVSIYLQNPGYLQNHREGESTDEILQIVLDTVFHNWITLPIATKNTGKVVYNATDTLVVAGNYISTKILAKADFIGDSSIITTNAGSMKTDTVASKHCKLTITAVLDPVTYPGKTITHVRDIWFVPKIGYIAKFITRTNVPYIQFLVVPTDTTAIEKTLASYKLL